MSDAPSDLKDVVSATREYETWMKRLLPAHGETQSQHLKVKHGAMATDAFQFLRATFYRWMQRWPEECPELAKHKSDEVLAVGDIHLENFGTWRDSEGRLVWGVNDFDEASRLPFTQDLIRVAVSISLAAELDHFSMPDASACDALLAGYADACDSGGAPFILDTSHQTLRTLIQGALQEGDVRKFWSKLQNPADYPETKQNSDLPKEALDLIHQTLPPDVKNVSYRLVKKPKGLGSLGHPRFVGLVEWCGGFLAREAKQLVPSAAAWLQNPGSATITAGETLAAAIRSADPAYRISGNWTVRRLGPDAVRVEIGSLQGKGHETKLASKLFEAMGAELANIHLGSKSASVLKDRLKSLAKEDPDWLKRAMERMRSATEEDFDDWQKASRHGEQHS